MDFSKYCGILYYLCDHSYPKGCVSEVDKKRLRNAARGYVHHNGVLYRRDAGNQLGREVLHEGNMEEVVSRVHSEGHMGINNTWRRLRLQYDARLVS